MLLDAIELVLAAALAEDEDADDDDEPVLAVSDEICEVLKVVPVVMT
jgi:hypothetical protein